MIVSPPTVTRLWTVLLLLMVGIVFLWLGFFIAQSGKDHSHPADLFLKSLHAQTQVLLQAQLLTPFTLTDHHQRTITFFSFNKQWTFLYFGYTHCRSECSQTLQILKQVHDQLEKLEEESSTQFWFITIDPHRDTAEQLANYVPLVSRHLLGITGEPTDLSRLMQSLGVTYQQVDNPENESVVDHPTMIFLIDPLGRLRAKFLPPHLPDHLVSDFQKIREYYAEECCLPSEPLKTIFIKGKS